VINLIGQRDKLDFTRVEDGEALYYISDFTIPRSGNKQLTFNIDVSPAGGSAKHTIEFKRQY
jgi:hypothetical protein